MPPVRINDKYSALPTIAQRYYARRIDKKLCMRAGCTDPPREGKRECIKHSNESNERAKRFYHQHKEVKGVEQPESKQV